MGTPAAIESTRRTPAPASAAHAAATSFGFTATTAASAGPDRIEDRNARELGTQDLTTLGHDLDDRELVGRRPSGGEQAAEQGLAHPSTTDEEQPCRHVARD